MEMALWITLGEQEHYGQSLRRHAGLFSPDGRPAAGGITLDPARYARAAWAAATDMPADHRYLSHHPAVLDAAVRLPDDAPGLLVVLELASPPPFLPAGWQTWQQPGYRTPPRNTPAALGRLELRIPIQDAALPTPTHPQAEGLPNLMDAEAAVEALLDHIDRAAAPFLRPGAPR